MATETDVLKLRITSRDGSDAADLANIIADLGEDVDAKVGNPALTTTQINALTGDEKAAGRRVWDTTLGVEKVSNGTTWETMATKAQVDALRDTAYQTWTPVVSLQDGSGVTNDVIEARYQQVGKRVTGWAIVSITLLEVSEVSAVQLSLPVAPRATARGDKLMGQWNRTNGSNYTEGQMRQKPSTNLVYLYWHLQSAMTPQILTTSGIAAGTSLSVQFDYEAA